MGTASVAFYAAIGFEFAGKVSPDDLLWTGIPQKLMGIPDLKSVDWVWQVPPGQGFFQLETFQFDNPRGQANLRRVSDIGIARCSIFVEDFAGAVERLSSLGHAPITPVQHFPGLGARVAFRDPAGGVVELMDTDLSVVSDGGNGAKVAVRVIALTVPDLRRSADFLTSIFGLSEIEDAAHTLAMELLWGLEAPVRDLVTMHDSASDVLIELLQYTTPQSRPRPANYSLADHGFTHIVGLGTHNYTAFEQTHSRIIAGGYPCNSKPVRVPGCLAAVYCHDHDGFTYELEQFPRFMSGLLGYEAKKERLVV